jgi:hypothetical protein
MAGVDIWRFNDHVRAQQLEQLGLLHISPQQPRNLGFGSTIKLHP